jgi:hypothetical protein
MRVWPKPHHIDVESILNASHGRFTVRLDRGIWKRKAIRAERQAVISTIYLWVSLLGAFFYNGSFLIGSKILSTPDFDCPVLSSTCY